MLEAIYKFLANLCHKLTVFFRDRQRALHTARMLREFPEGSCVRIACDCDSRVEDHQGVWYVLDYSPDAGDFRVVRTMPRPEQNIFNEMYRYVRPEQLQRVP